MTPYETLFLAHLLGDWILQTEWQALNKTTNWRALLGHIVVYHSIMLAAMLTRFSYADARVWFALVFIALTHAILDRRAFTLKLMQVFRSVVQREPEFWLILAVDQSLHLIVIGLIVSWMT